MHVLQPCTYLSSKLILNAAEQMVGHLLATYSKVCCVIFRELSYVGKINVGFAENSRIWIKENVDERNFYGL